MGSGLRIVFLGTGGGRFVTITQRRRTAGIRILGESLNIHLDPGPGALVHSIGAELDPRQINAVLVSHCHPDHYTDAEVMVEAMTQGMTRKQGFLIAPRSVLKGSDTCEASISKYHQRMVKNTFEAVTGVKFDIDNIEILPTVAKHTDPDCVGFRFETEFGDFAYTSDTEYFDGIAEYYRGLRLLILCVMRPSGKPWKGHLTTDDAIRIVCETDPELVVLTHLGFRMLLQDPLKEARLVEQKTGVGTIAALDGMVMNFENRIAVESGKENSQQDLTGFL